MESFKVFDSTWLREWQQVDPDNWRSMATEIVSHFLLSAVSKQAQIQVAWRAKNWQQLAELAHTLKSSCGNVGAVRAQHLLNEIEQAAGRKDLMVCNLRIQEFNETFDSSLRELMEFKTAIAKPPSAS